MTMHSDGEQQINHDIDVRYEDDVIEAFNKFIKKWCGKYYPHLIDDDENDGQFMREKIEASHSHLIEEVEKMKKLTPQGVPINSTELQDIAARNFNEALDLVISLLKRKA